MNLVHLGILFRRLGSAAIDLTIEVTGGLLGSYFGAMVAALVMAMRNESSDQMQISIWNGFGFGFVFWTLAISFLNRVLIQGLSRSSIGKKVFKLELISTRKPLTWNTMMKRWILSIVSMAVGGIGYAVMFFNREGHAFHDIIAMTDVVPMFESSHTFSMEHRDESEFHPSTTLMPSLANELSSRIFVMANTHAERPMATIIKLPAIQRESFESSVVQPTLAEVIELKPKQNIVANEIQVTSEEAEEKKVA